MRTFPWNHPLGRSTGIGILLIGLFLLPYTKVVAQPPESFKPTPVPASSLYEIHFHPTYTKTLCVGQKTTLLAKYGVSNPDLAEFLSVSRLVIVFDHGTIEGSTTRTPGTNSGTEPFVFTATSTGSATIKMQLFTVNPLTGKESMDTTSAPIKIKIVKECWYHWTIAGDMKVQTTAGSDVLELEWILDSKGGLRPVDPANPENFKTPSTSTITLEIYERYISGDCAILNFSGGGLGFLDATATITDDGTMLDVKFEQPQQFDWDFQATGYCGDSDPHTSTAGGTLTFTDDPWIEVKFPVEGGSSKIKLDMLERGVNNFKKSGGSGSYTATLTVERSGTE
jgi:hypothetical protein